ncbi:hypothetical protein [Desemzia incerta]|uniref:hypothetical protein n=1 Tax=Desemzia incerta TaxID=82801 RepID=UPI0015A6ADED|nr:hypothetical protein [Desemzia incerta]
MTSSAEMTAIGIKTIETITPKIIISKKFTKKTAVPTKIGTAVFFTSSLIY